jgi:hypothetical protein
MFTKTELKAFRQDFANTVKDLEKKYGVKVELGSISYGETDFHTKMTCTKTSSDGKKKVDTVEFELLKGLLGFKGNIGDKYVSKGITFTITGLDGKKPKFPVLIEGSNGKKYKATVQSANMQLLIKN